MKIKKEHIRRLVQEEIDKASQTDTTDSIDKTEKRANVKKLMKKIETLSKQLAPLLEKIKGRVEFEGFLRSFMKLGSKNTTLKEIDLALRNVLRDLEDKL